MRFRRWDDFGGTASCAPIHGTGRAQSDHAGSLWAGRRLETDAVLGGDDPVNLEGKMGDIGGMKGLGQLDDLEGPH